MSGGDNGDPAQVPTRWNHGQGQVLCSYSSLCTESSDPGETGAPGGVPPSESASVLSACHSACLFLALPLAPTAPAHTASQPALLPSLGPRLLRQHLHTMTWAVCRPHVSASVQIACVWITGMMCIDTSTCRHSSRTVTWCVQTPAHTYTGR